MCKEAPRPPPWPIADPGPLRWAAAMAPLLLLTMPGAPAGATLAHDVKLFASTMAIARTTRETCPDILVDDRIFEGIRQELHVIDADHTVFAAEAHALADDLQKATAAAPSRQAWCDATFRLYGPDGKAIWGLMLRR